MWYFYIGLGLFALILTIGILTIGIFVWPIIILILVREFISWIYDKVNKHDTN